MKTVKRLTSSIVAAAILGSLLKISTSKCKADEELTEREKIAEEAFIYGSPVDLGDVAIKKQAD
jgi:hypothetical protein